MMNEQNERTRSRLCGASKRYVDIHEDLTLTPSKLQRRKNFKCNPRSLKLGDEILAHESKNGLVPSLKDEIRGEHDSRAENRLGCFWN